MQPVVASPSSNPSALEKRDELSKNNRLSWHQVIRGCCLGRVLCSIVERIKLIVRWIICRIAACFGVIVHGHLAEHQLENRLHKFDVAKLMKSGPYSSPVLSNKAQIVIRKSLQGLSRAIDSHLHILGYDGGNYLNPKLDKCCSGIKFAVIHCAAAGTPNPVGSTALATRRLQQYAEHFPKFHGMILPIHPAVSSDGTIDWERTGSYLKSSVALHAAKKFRSNHAKLFPGISVHPHDPNWEKRLQKARKKGILLVKWYPTQGIDASSPALDRFYQTMKDLGMVLIAHSGPQHAFPANKAWENFGDPKYFERPLKVGVNVILAHSGHKEKWRDFIALAVKAHKAAWPGKLYGDLGGMLHYGPEFAKSLVMHSQKKGVRIVYGSDYPYINLVKPFNDPYKMLSKAGLLSNELVGPLQEIRNWNPLLANFVAVRNMTVKVKEKKVAFPEATFTGEFSDGTLELVDEASWENFKSGEQDRKN